MTPVAIYSLGGVLLFSLGISGMFLCRHPLRKILAMNFAGSGVFTVFIAMASRHPAVASDPVPNALVLTGIVVAVSATAVALALYRRLVTLADDRDPSEQSRG